MDRGDGYNGQTSLAAKENSEIIRNKLEQVSKQKRKYRLISLLLILALVISTVALFGRLWTNWIVLSEGETRSKNDEPLEHVWRTATCTLPRMCEKCFLTEGEPLGHQWQVATCTESQLCSVCGEIGAVAMGHDWKAATYVTPETCLRCGITQGSAMSIEVGDIITFGSYEQDCNFVNGSEPINWYVLDIQGSKALLLAEKCIETMAYHREKIDMTWSGCSLRHWLNDSFYSMAFSEKQCEAILLSQIHTPDNWNYNTSGGSSTMDYIFLLSTDEAEWYIQNQGVIPSYTSATAFAEINGAGDLGTSVYWWSRSSGKKQNQARPISTIEFKLWQGDRVNCEDNVVRPAMWVDLDSPYLKQEENVSVNNYLLTTCRILSDSNEEGSVSDVAIGIWKEKDQSKRGGRIYPNAIKFWVMDRPNWSNVEHIEFALDGRYNVLRGNAVIHEDSQSGANAHIRIFLDGELAYESVTISGLDEAEFKLKVSGVRTIRIECITDSPSSAYCIVDAWVTQE